MKIIRAHDYDAVERVRVDMERLPERWRAEVYDAWQWIVLPDDLKPTWIGLTLRSPEEWLSSSSDDRTPDNIGGWCAGEQHSYWVRDTPHIYLQHSSTVHAVHESAHALSTLWHTDIAPLRKSGTPFYEYMDVDDLEYFACGVDAYCRPAGDDVNWNRDDLARMNPDLYQYLRAKDTTT